MTTPLNFSPAAPLRAARPAAAVASPARLTAVEADQIADAFPARPSVAQKLYGPGRQVTQSAPLGGRIDLSA